MANGLPMPAEWLRVDTATRKNVGYVRMLNPPSCRCSVLAGRFYRWNNGFLRHPKCDCVHVQTPATARAAETEGLVHDPYEYFIAAPARRRRTTRRPGRRLSMTALTSSRFNSRPADGYSRAAEGLFTSEGTTKRGNFRAGELTKGKRLTVDAIYKLNGGNGRGSSRRAGEVRLRPAGRSSPWAPLWASVKASAPRRRRRIRWQLVSALRMHRTGADPAVRATMTEAERRCSTIPGGSLCSKA